jgi:HTH-type transcriptional regulator/antitoxin HigA
MRHTLVSNVLVENQDQLFDRRPKSPGKILRELMEERGWTQDDLAVIMARSRQSISDIVAGKRGITPEMAIALAAAFGNAAQDWLKWDQLYRLSLAEEDSSGIERMAHLYGIAPIRDMQKRGWIAPTADLTALEEELQKFFGPELDGALTLQIAAHRTVALPYLNAAEKAWCFRARQLARALAAPPFNPSRMDEAEKKLRQLASFPKEARHVPKVLGEYGIRLVVVEPIPGVKIDGATFWLDAQPVIAMSLRYDRIDGFWFTLMHELAHVRAGDASVDTDLIDGAKGIAVMLVEDEAERVASARAAAALVPKQEMDSFVSRVGPFYPRDRVIQFAHKVKIHPGIIVGQLQHRNELGYSALRDMLVKVRDIVVSTALTDGWNQSVAPGIL